jgi:hypothetical protein
MTKHFFPSGAELYNTRHPLPFGSSMWVGVELTDDDDVYTHGARRLLSYTQQKTHTHKSLAPFREKIPTSFGRRSSNTSPIPPDPPPTIPFLPPTVRLISFSIFFAVDLTDVRFRLLFVQRCHFLLADRNLDACSFIEILHNKQIGLNDEWMETGNKIGDKTNFSQLKNRKKQLMFVMRVFP